MKIAISHLRHAKVGGTERFLNQISTALADRGHDVTILCRSHEETHHPAIKFVTFRDFTIGRGHRLWRFAKSVQRYISENKYDLVFGLGRTWSQDVIRVGGGLYRDQIVQGRGKQRYWPRDLIAEAIERRTFAAGHYQHVIANSFLTQRALIDAYQIPKDRISTIHNAVDLVRFNDRFRETSGLTLRTQCGFEPHHRVYLFLGSGFRRKGLDRLLNAFPQVLDQQPDSRLMIVGNDSHQRHYEALAKKLNLDSKAIFLGKRRDVELCYNTADIYVMPSRFDAFGFSALEALACGLPVIITNTSGASEIMTPEVSEVISTPKEEDLVDLLAQAMLKIEEGAQSPYIRQKCRALAANYAEDVVMDKNIKVLEALGFK